MPLPLSNSLQPNELEYIGYMRGAGLEDHAVEGLNGASAMGASASFECAHDGSALARVVAFCRAGGGRRAGGGVISGSGGGPSMARYG